MLPSGVAPGYSTMGSLRGTGKSSATNSAPASVSLKTGATLLTAMQGKTASHGEMLVSDDAFSL